MSSKWKWTTSSSGAEKTKGTVGDQGERDSFSHEKYQRNRTHVSDVSSDFTRMVLGATPENTYDRPKWESFDIFDILQVHLEDYSLVDESLFPGLPSLRDVYPEIYNILSGYFYGTAEPAPRLWKACIDALNHAVDTQNQRDKSGTDNPEYNKPAKKRNKTDKRRSHPDRLGDLAGINRPLVVTILQAICAQFVDCLAFEDLRYAWKTEKYAFRGIRIGPNNGERIRIELREDVCWRARKQASSRKPSREVPVKKIGLGPLFAVLKIKNPEEFTDLRLSALADLKALLTILQDRRREAAYTTTDDTSARDQIYSSYIVSVSSSIAGYVSINTLTASGHYLTAIESGDPPPKGEKLLYRRGQNLDLCNPHGRVEFARIMLGLLSKVCEKKQALDKEQPAEDKQVTQKLKSENPWQRVRKKSRLTVSILPDNPADMDPSEISNEAKWLYIVLTMRDFCSTFRNR